jgi:hypothetical protein
MPHLDAYVVLGECRAAIHHHDAVRLLDGKAVHANLSEAAQRHDSDLI